MCSEWKENWSRERERRHWKNEDSPHYRSFGAKRHAETFASSNENSRRKRARVKKIVEEFVASDRRFSFRKIITITAERLSDHSRITFNFSSNRTIEELRALLNHHLPPQTANKFFLYSYQRGALIHFHPSSFKLDFFPVIFDQSVLLLQMDDSPVEHFSPINDDYFAQEMKLRRSSSRKSSRPASTSFSSSASSSSSNSFRKASTCSTLLRTFFQRCFNRRNDVHYPNLLSSCWLVVK